MPVPYPAQRQTAPVARDTTPDAVAGVAEQLYGLPPEQFTAARDAAARAVDSQDRPAVKALRRPTVSAWVVNRLRREQGGLLEQLLQLGPALAAAQAQRSGADLRALGRQRRELVQQVTASALHDVDASASVRTEVEQTLEAALADPAAADAVRSGALVRPLAFAGFGGVDLEGAVAAPARPSRAAAAACAAAEAPAAAQARPAQSRPAPARTSTAAVQRAQRAVQDAAAALDDAVGAAETAQARYDGAQAAADEAGDERAAAEREVGELERQLAAARARLQQAGAREHDLREQLQRVVSAAERARRRVAEAQEHDEQARTAYDRLRRG